MLITRKSILDNVERTKEIDVTQAQLDEYKNSRGRLIQDIMPNLSDDDREFIMTGITPEQWDNQFKEQK